MNDGRDDGATLVRLEGVTRRYPVSAGGATPFALAPTTLSIERGSFTALTGRSGAGKTTLLQLLAGLDRADAGRLWMFGRDVTAASEGELARLRRDRIGVVHQQPFFVDHLPLWQNVTLRLVPLGVGTRERRSRAAAALEEVELRGVLDRAPRGLSGGEQQRAAVARALIADPELLLADEPTASVDAQSGAAIAELLERRRAHGTTLVVATHDERLVARATSRRELVEGRLAP
jgi:putative ABC transport system ATP-binding protein